MRNSHRGRMAVVAVLASVAALMAMAAPSSAATTNVTWSIAGHITTHWDGVTHTLNGGGTPICVPGTPATPKVVTHVNDATGVTHITGSTAYSGFQPADVNIAGTNYQAIITGTNTTSAGSIAGTTVTQNVALTVTIKSCNGASTLCTFPITASVSGHNYTGGAIPATGNTVTVSGSSAPISPAIGCNVAVRPTILGSTVGVTLTLTAH